MAGIRQKESDLPLRTYINRDTYYYVSKDTGKWIRLSTNKSEAIKIAKALNGNNPLPEKPSYNLAASHVKTVREGFKQLRQALKMHSSAKGGARGRGLIFELSKQNVVDLLISSQGRCMATGIEFSEIKEPGIKMALWQPSIDRIDSSKGYTLDNIRIVCVAFNISIQNFGDAIFKKLAEAYLDTRLRSENEKINPE